MAYQSIAPGPALYCGTYAKYNNGSLDGDWLNLPDYPDAEAFLEACRKLHADEEQAEFMFQDSERVPCSLHHESLSPADLEKLYDWVNLETYDRELCAEYMDTTGEDLADIDIDDVRDKLFFIFDRSDESSDEVAIGSYVIDEELIEVPEHLRSYIDVELLGRDWLMDLYVSPGGYVFEA